MQKSCSTEHYSKIINQNQSALQLFSIESLNKHKDTKTHNAMRIMHYQKKNIKSHGVTLRNSFIPNSKFLLGFIMQIYTVKCITMQKHIEI